MNLTATVRIGRSSMPAFAVPTPTALTAYFQLAKCRSSQAKCQAAAGSLDSSKRSALRGECSRARLTAVKAGLYNALAHYL